MASLEKQETKKVLPHHEQLSKPKPLSSLKSLKAEKGSSKKEVTIQKPVEREFSPKIKQIIRRLRFRLKLYLGVMKAKEINADNNEPTNPEYKILVKILKNAYRSNESAQKVLDYIRHLPFFNEFIKTLGEVEDRALHELCKRLKYEYVPAGTYVFKEGDQSDHKYYIVLRGQVSVVKKKDTNVFYQMRLARLKAIDEEKTQEEIHMENLIGEMGVKVKDINEGEGFEEKALIEKNSRRGCSILTNETCEFIVVLKEDYNQIMSRFDQKRIVKKEFMMKSIPFLDSINSMAIIEDLFYLLKDEDLPRDATITTEGHIGDYVYFIASGECTVEKTFAIKNIKRGADYGSFDVKKVIATIDVGSCFGEELLLEDNNTYNYTIKVKSSSATFHYVDKSVFLMKFPPECIRIVMESFKLKDSVHQTRIQELSKDVMETANEKHEAPPRLKGAEIFRLLRPQYRMKMAQHLYKTLKRNVNSISSPQGVQDSNQDNKIRIPLEDIVEDSMPAPREPKGSLTTPMRTKTPGKAFPTNFPEVHTLQMGNKSISSGHHRTLTRRHIDSKLENSEMDSLNKTQREKSSFGDWVASSNRKDSSARKSPMKNPQSPKKDEIITNEPDKKLNNDYFSISSLNVNSTPKMEKFDFGPSPYLTDKYQKFPRVATTSQTNLASFHSSKVEPSSATLKLAQLDFDEVKRARNEFTNIIERVRGDRTSPAVFSKLTGFIDKRSKSNKKKLRRDADGNMIMIRSIAATSTSIAKGSLDLGECSPISRVYNSKLDRGSLEEIGPDIIREDEGQSSFKRMGSRESLQYLDPETPKLMTRTRIRISRESTKSMVDNKLLNMVKGRYQDKLQEKIALKPKVWPVK